MLRKTQLDILNLKKTGLATAIDLGDEKNIHPLNKMDVGKRLAIAALAIEYGQKLEYMGPVYKSHSIEQGKITIQFTHADGLNAKDSEKLQGFAIAGADGKFVWADATISGNEVIVSNDIIKEPKAVRYGWANYSTGNLYNGSGLPAYPFRTDR